MKKLILTIFLSVIFICAANAQFIKSGIAVTAVTPVGNFSDNVETGFGGVFMAKLGLPILDITGSVEYLNFSKKEIGTVKLSSYMWSINAGARVSVFPFVSAGAEIGNYWITVTTETSTGKSNNTQNKVAFTPLISVQIGIFEGSVRYTIIENASFLAIRAGIYF